MACRGPLLIQRLLQISHEPGSIQSVFSGIFLKHHNDAHPPVPDILGILRQAKVLVCATPHGCYLSVPNPGILQETPGCVGPVGGQFPVCVVLAPIGPTIGMPFHRDAVRKSSQFLRDKFQQVLGLGLEVGAAEVKKMGILQIQQLDTQALVGDLQGYEVGLSSLSLYLDLPASLLDLSETGAKVVYDDPAGKLHGHNGGDALGVSDNPGLDATQKDVLQGRLILDLG